MSGGVIVGDGFDAASIRAVGFDLDHTLALYHDEAVDELAIAETVELLAGECGYPASEFSTALNGIPRAIRGLAVDAVSGAMVKVGGNGYVVRAWRGGDWVSPDTVRSTYGTAPFNLGVTPKVLESHFDLPTAALFSAVTSARAASLPDATDWHRTCMDIRRMLDKAHTKGRFKTSILSDLQRLVKVTPDVGKAVGVLRSRGLSTFILTNSPRDYTLSLLDHVLGADDWPSLFDAVVTDAGKPRFFTAPDLGGTASDHRGVPVIDGGHVGALAAYLNAEPHETLYIGDNPAADLEPARAIGWRTGAVVAEMSGDHKDAPWGDPLSDINTPGYFFARILACSDVVAPDLNTVIGETLL